MAPKLRRLLPDRPLRSGRLLRCPDCAQLWHLDEDEAFIRTVPASRIEILERWNRGPLVLSEDIIARLKAIGANAPDPYGIVSGRASVPCRVLTHQGEEVELSIVRFQKIPPIEQGLEKARLIDEIQDIQPSCYTLPAQVRYATAQAGEIAMGLAPTLVRTPDGREFTLNGSNEFFVDPHVAAAEITLSRRKIDRENLPPDAGCPWDRITFFIGDWSESLRALYLTDK